MHLKMAWATATGGAICAGTADEVQILAAQTLVNGGKVILVGHTFNISAAGMIIDNCTLDGQVSGNITQTKGVSLICSGQIILRNKVESEGSGQGGRLWNVTIINTAACKSPLTIKPTMLWSWCQKILDNVFVYDTQAKYSGSIGLDINCTSTGGTLVALGVCSFGNVSVYGFDISYRLYTTCDVFNQAWINANDFGLLQGGQGNITLQIVNSNANGAYGTIVENKFTLYSELAANWDVDISGAGGSNVIQNEFDCYYIEQSGHIRSNGSGNLWFVTNAITITDTSSAPDIFIVKGDALPAAPASHLSDQSYLTIASGAITVTPSMSNVLVEVESGTADDLTTINGGTSGQILVIQTMPGAHTITVKNNAGNIQCGADVILNNNYKSIMLIYNQQYSAWCMINYH